MSPYFRTMLTIISIPHSPAPTITYSCAFPATCASPFRTLFRALHGYLCPMQPDRAISYGQLCSWRDGHQDQTSTWAFRSLYGLEMMFDKGRRVARWKKGTTVDIVVTISHMEWVRYWDDEMIIAGDAVDDYIWWVIIFIFIFEFQLFLPSSYLCHWTHPLLRSISTDPCLLYCHFISYIFVLID